MEPILEILFYLAFYHSLVELLDLLKGFLFAILILLMMYFFSDQVKHLKRTDYLFYFSGHLLLYVKVYMILKKSTQPFLFNYNI
jgi:predicted tellurium resistance membrane protein TerC